MNLTDPAVLAVLVVAALLCAVVFFLLAQSRGRAAALAASQEQLGELKLVAETYAERLRKAEIDCAAATARAGQLGSVETRLHEAEARNSTLRAELAGRDSRAEADALAFAERAADLTRLRGELESHFKNLATQALGDNRQSFLDLANESFSKHRAEANAEIDTRRKAVDELVRPIGETLQQTRDRLDQIERDRAASFGQIREQLATVGHEAARLTQALRANPGTRGRWGEESLKNALELAGLSAHCDFETQKTFTQLDSNIRPDCVIRLPGRRCIVVDAKAPITGYLDAMEATDDIARAAGMKKHADGLRQHMLSLSRKEYSQTVAAHLSARPDFVAMYVPGENFYAAAIEKNAELFAESIGRGVFIVTPTTLIALAKSIALGWQQEAIAENAREIAKLGSELYVRLCAMGSHVSKMGDNLDKAVKGFNAFVGSLEGSVLPQARKFKDLRVSDGARILEELAPIETDARKPAGGRDLVFQDQLALSDLTAAE